MWTPKSQNSIAGYVPDVRAIDAQVNKLFEKRSGLVSLWQQQADNFYPERADFTSSRGLGADFGAGMMTSYPTMARRDLGNAFSSMLRPTGKPWALMTVDDAEHLDRDGKAWLEWATGVQRRRMYERSTNFVRATKEGDHDFAAFGQTVISTELNRDRTSLLYRCWHLRDVVWCENAEGKIDTVALKWSTATCRDVMRMFPKTCPKHITDQGAKDPYAEVEIRRYVTAGENLDLPVPWVSIYYEAAKQTALEVVKLHSNPYTIPRWQTVSGSQYAHSPATVVGLADARLLQVITRVLLEAGEKLVNPPMVATQDVIRSDIQIYAGGTTWVDAEYDERLGEALRPMAQDKSGMPLGLDMQQDVRQMIDRAFFLDKIRRPMMSKQMTAYEYSQLLDGWISDALPLFEPMESDYNGSLCESTMDALLAGMAFGPPHTMPRSLQGREIRFKFQSPLQDAMAAKKGTLLQQVKALLATVVDIDQSTVYVVDAKKAFRDALDGIQTPAGWMRTEEEVEDLAADEADSRQEQATLDQMQQGSEIAESLGKAEQMARKK